MAGQPTGRNDLPASILIVDDDASVAQAVLEPLARYGVKADKAKTLDTALQMFDNGRYEAVLIELEFNPMSGLALVQKWRDHEVLEKIATPFIMLTGNKSSKTHQGMFKELGHLELLVKPFTVPQLLIQLNRALTTKKQLGSILEVRAKVMGFFETTKDFEKASHYVMSHLQEMGPQGYRLLYDLYEKAGKWSEALAVVEKLLADDPKNIALISYRGRLLMRLGKLSEACEVMERADEVAPLNIRRLGELSEAYLGLKEPDKAVVSMGRMLSLTPDQPDLKFEMFSKLYDHGFDDHAIAFGKQNAQPVEIVRHYNNKGVFLSKEGNTKKALQEYQRALRYNPKYRENYRILYNIALANMSFKTPDSYRTAYESLLKCIELAPEFEKAHTTLKSLEQVLEKIKKVS